MNESSNPKVLEDINRTRKIELDLKNQKRPWFFKRYANRSLFQWVSLEVGLILILIIVMKNSWNIGDLFVILLVGFNISAWVYEGFLNQQSDLLEESTELIKKLLAQAILLTKYLAQSKGIEYEE